MNAVDTNVLVRLLTGDDAWQAAAADGIAATGVWVSTLVLAEAVWVLSYTFHRPPQAIAAAVEFLLQHQTIAVQDPELAEAALAQFRAVPRVGFTDCLVLEIARRAGHLPLASFDRKLGRLPDTLLLA